MYTLTTMTVQNFIAIHLIVVVVVIDISVWTKVTDGRTNRLTDRFDSGDGNYKKSLNQNGRRF